PNYLPPGARPRPANTATTPYMPNASAAPPSAVVYPNVAPAPYSATQPNISNYQQPAAPPTTPPPSYAPPADISTAPYQPPPGNPPGYAPPGALPQYAAPGFPADAGNAFGPGAVPCGAPVFGVPDAN